MPFKIFGQIAADLMFTRHGSLLVSGLPIQTDVQNTSRLAFPHSPMVCRIWLNGLQNIPVRRFAWNPLVNIGFLSLIFWKNPAMWFWRILNTPSPKKITKPTEGMQNGSATCSCVT